MEIRNFKIRRFPYFPIYPFSGNFFRNPYRIAGFRGKMKGGYCKSKILNFLLCFLKEKSGSSESTDFQISSSLHLPETFSGIRGIC